jgi:phenylacetate-CoA ligase
MGSLCANVADSERERRMLQRTIGRGVGYRTLNFGVLDGHLFRVQTATRAGTLWPGRLGFRRTRVPETGGLDAMIERLNAERPDQLGGFGSTMTALFTRLDVRGAPFHHPRLMRYGADAMPETVRRMIVDKHGIEVFSAYQCVEALKIGWECEAHQGYHINEDHYPVRIVNESGDDVAAGETGEVVLCNLVNRGTVLLNYRIGDVAQRIDEPCPCGRNLPRIGYVQGRTTDSLLAMDGRRVSFTVLERAIRERGGAYQYQILQEGRDRIAIDYVAAPGCDHADLLARVTEAAHGALGEQVMVTLRPVAEIVRPAGKWRYVINRTHADDAQGEGSAGPASPGVEGRTP